MYDYEGECFEKGGVVCDAFWSFCQGNTRTCCNCYEETPRTVGLGGGITHVVYVFMTLLFIRESYKVKGEIGNE